MRVQRALPAEVPFASHGGGTQLHAQSTKAVSPTAGTVGSGNSLPAVSRRLPVSSGFHLVNLQLISRRLLLLTTFSCFS